jgi:hypothetical protein
MRPPRVTHATRQKASEIAGPWFSEPVVCLRCGARKTVTYAVPPLMFKCYPCGRYSAVRDEDGVPREYHDTPDFVN